MGKPRDKDVIEGMAKSPREQEKVFEKAYQIALDNAKELYELFNDFDWDDDMYRHVRATHKKWLKGWQNKFVARQINDIIDLMYFLPDMLHLSLTLFFNESVPATYKVLLLAGAMYVISPIDLVPDIIPILGHVDDLSVVAFILYRTVVVIGMLPEEVVLNSFAGEQTTIKKVRNIIQVLGLTRLEAVNSQIEHWEKDVSPKIIESTTSKRENQKENDGK